MPAAERQEQVIRYTPRAAQSAPAERDLILIEQEKWGPFCGILTRMGLARYLRAMFSADQEPSDEQAVNCCGAGGPLAIPIYVYELSPGVQYSLRSTVGNVGETGTLEPLIERETVSFGLATEASISHPASAIRQARWLTGPWTTGGADVTPPTLTLDGRTVRSPIPIFGSVELTLEVRRWRHLLLISKEEAEELLIKGWAEYVMGLPSGGRPVGVEIEEPPGAAEMAKYGYACGRGKGGGASGTINGPEDDNDEPVATGANKYIHCDYCKLECEDPDEQGGKQ